MHSTKIIYVLFIFINFTFYYCTLVLGQTLPLKSETTTSVTRIGLENQPFELKHAGHFVWQDSKTGEKTAVLSGKVHLVLEKDQITIMADTVWYYSISSLATPANI